MKKFDRLLTKIETHGELALDLTDFGLRNEQIQLLVDKLNGNTKINILTLKHNSLDDSCVQSLIDLRNIEYLDISYNNFTQKGINELNDSLKSKFSSFNICAEHNNTNPLFFTRYSTSIIPTSVENVNMEVSVDGYVAVLVEAVSSKLLEIKLSPEQLELVKEKFIYKVSHDSKVFEFADKKLLSNRVTIK